MECSDNRPYPWIKAHLDSGCLGALTLLHVCIAEPGDLKRTLALCTGLCEWLLGAPIQIAAQLGGLDAECALDCAACAIEFQSGVIAVCEARIVAPEASTSSLEAHGTRGAIDYDGADGRLRMSVNGAKKLPDVRLIDEREWRGFGPAFAPKTGSALRDAAILAWCEGRNVRLDGEVPAW